VLNVDALYNSALKINELLASRGLSVQKKFGQNFLIHPEVRAKLCDALGAARGDRVWEIGAGLGAETALLLRTGAEVCAFELDRGFCAVLDELFCAAYPDTWSLVKGDVLHTWKAQARAETAGRGELLLFGNLPYNIAGLLTGTFIENGMIFRRCVVTVQKEVACRMLSPAGGADYSPLSVLCQAVYTARRVANIKRANFYPAPNVDSVCVQFDKRPALNERVFAPDFSPLVRALFAQRRKTLSNNLQVYLGGNRDVAEAVLDSCGIDRTARAEMLAPEDFFALHAALRGIAPDAHYGFSI
jgi:16S rRNA (adenine1518-N6/adenine1519-N6)-dimethyltransferase